MERGVGEMAEADCTQGVATRQMQERLVRCR